MKNEVTDARVQSWQPPKFWEFIFQPFNYIAGEKALIFGLIAIIVSGLLAYFSDAHFDGIIDLHFFESHYWYISIIEGFINSFIAAITFFVAAILLSKSRVRLVDMLGTQMFARWPMVFSVLAALVLPHKHINDWIKFKFLKDAEAVADPTLLQWTSFILLTIIILTCVIWMVALMWKSYIISSNLKGTKSVISFIICIIIAILLAEILTNLLYKNLQVSL